MKVTAASLSLFIAASALSFFWLGCEDSATRKSETRTEDPPCKCPVPEVKKLKPGTYTHIKEGSGGFILDFSGLKATATRENIIIEGVVTGPDNKKVTVRAEYTIAGLKVDD